MNRIKPLKFVRIFKFQRLFQCILKVHSESPASIVNTKKRTYTIYHKGEHEMQVREIIGKDREIVIELNKEISIIDPESSYKMSLEKKNGKGYEIQKNDDLITVKYETTPELGRAILRVSTLEVPESEKSLKGVKEKADGKCFDDFGIMLDVSRNAVLKVGTVKKMLRLAALMGYDFVGLYMEDTLKIECEPYWGYQRGAYTADEIREMDDYAASIGMELRPFIQTLAHVNQVARYEEYAEIIDTGDILLAGEGRTAELIDHLLGTVAKLFHTKKVNIGMDEAYLVGRGRYTDKNGYEPRKEIMQKHLKLVLDACRKYGLKAQMWSDMFFGFAVPEKVSEKKSEGIVPEDVEICYWDYYSQEPEHYEERIKAHLALTKNVGFAGGAWKWSGIAPHDRYSIKANEAAIGQCRKYGLKSYTVTCWGDNGAEAGCFSILPVIYKTAEMVYGDRNSDTEFMSLTGIGIEDFLKIDDANPYLENGDRHNNISKFLLFNDPLYGTFDPLIPDDLMERFHKADGELKDVINKAGQKYRYLFETERALVRVLTIKADMGIRIRNAYKKRDKEALKDISSEILEKLVPDIELLYEEFKAQWHRENKDHGFEVQAIRFGGLIQRLKDVRQMIDNFIDKNDPIEILEEEQQGFAYCTADGIDTMNYNLWSNIVSPNVIG